ncbi:capsule biosynthesis GfcC D2 domain-containing protein [Enterobacter hormaechei]|uniref:capsule biosynthesis GfcC D2 domain-containing protein n=1 Tax=Enterobacter hormaechei TaxID=158836 RepID=UPI00207575CB
MHQPGKTWSAGQADTLSRLVTQPQLKNVWWQGAVIATPSATRRAQQTQQQVLASLSAWQNRADDERIATIRAVAVQIRSLRIVGRQFVSLDQTPCVPMPAAIVPLRAVTICGSRLRPAPSR